MQQVISPGLGKILERGRHDFNAIFEERRRRSPSLSAQDFLSSFAAIAGEALTSLDPLLERQGLTEAGKRETAHETIKALYSIILEGMALRLLGPGAKHPLLEQGLRRITAAHPRALASDPVKFARSVINALARLEAMSPSMARNWTDTMETLGVREPHCEEFISLGFAAAWLSGMTAYRHKALDLLATLDPESAALLFGIQKLEREGLKRLCSLLSRDPWALPSATMEERRSAVLCCAGGHALFGGPFRTPPVVTNREGTMVALSDDRVFEIVADRFGTALIPGNDLDSDLPVMAEPPVSFKPGCVVVQGREYSLGEVESIPAGLRVPAFHSLPVTSTAHHHGTIFITLAVSCKIFILAPAGEMT